MRHFHIFLTALLSIILASAGWAQSPKKSVTMTITKEENGVRTVIDTSFMVNDPSEVEGVLKQMGIEEPKENQTLEKRIVIRDSEAPQREKYVEVKTGNPMIGVYLQDDHYWDGDEKKERKSKKGVLVTSVTENGGAQKAGMQKGDLILSINGEKMTSEDDIHESKSGMSPGDKMNIQFERDGKVKTATVTLESGTEKISKVRNRRISAVESKAFLGVVPHTVSEERARELNLKEPSGVYLSSIVEGEGAEAAGLEEGDVIVMMGAKEVHNNTDLRRVLAAHKGGDNLPIQYIRDGKRKNTTAVLGERQKTVYTHVQEWGEVVPEKRALLGVYLETNGDEGVEITEITSNGAAEAAGLEEGDKIVSLGGAETLTYEALVKALRSHQPGDVVDIAYIRDDNRKNTRATLKEKMVYNWVPSNTEKTTEIDVDVILKTFENKEQGAELSRYMKSPNLDMIEFSAFPNPNTGRFTVRFTPEEEGTILIKVYTLTGQVVYQEQLTDFTGGYEKEIDISENAKGVYFLQITQNGKGMAKRISVQ